MRKKLIRKAISKIDFIRMPKLDEEEPDDINKKFDSDVSNFFEMPILENYSMHDSELASRILGNLFYVLHEPDERMEKLIPLFESSKLIYKVIDLYCQTTEVPILYLCLLIFTDYTYHFEDTSMFCDIGLIEKIFGSTTSAEPNLSRASCSAILNLLVNKDIFMLKNVKEWFEIYDSFNDNPMAQIRFLYALSRHNPPPDQLYTLLDYTTTLMLENKNDFNLNELAIATMYYILNNSDFITQDYLSDLFSDEIFEIISNYLDFEDISPKAFDILKILYGFNINIQNILIQSALHKMLCALRSEPNKNLKVPILDFIRFLMEKLIWRITPDFIEVVLLVASDGCFDEKKEAIYIIKILLDDDMLKETDLNKFYTIVLDFLSCEDKNLIILVLEIINNLLYKNESFKEFLLSSEEEMNLLYGVIHDPTLMDLDDSGILNSIDKTLECLLSEDEE